MDKTIITDNNGVHTEVHYHLARPWEWVTHWHDANAATGSGTPWVSAWGVALLGALLLIAAILYFLPALLAYLRGVRGLTAVVLVNLMLGWTMIGWFAALVMALVMERRQDYEMRQHAYRAWLATQPPTMPTGG